MKTIFLLFIAGILADNSYPQISIHPNENNCDSYQYEPNPRDARTPIQVLVDSNSDFAFKLFREVSSSESHQGGRSKSNAVFSPLCISSAFAMLALGAKDNTLDQILKGLDFRPSEIPERMIHEGFRDLTCMLNNGGVGHQMEIGKCLFVQNQLYPEEQFLSGLKNLYGGDIFWENFKNTAATEQHINSYIKRKTRGKISKLVDEVNPITEVLLVSYIYMKAKWKKPFNPKYTEEHNFYVNTHTVVKVPMMFQMGMFEIGRDEENFCTILKMPYEGHTAAYFILPDKGQLERVASSLSHGVLQKWKSILSKSSINVYIPKCLVSGEIKLKNIMNSLGVADVFTDKADLSGVTGQPHHRLSEAIHKAVIMIDEKGTEASAATSMDIVPLSAPIVIKYNSPFILIIQEQKTQSIIFIATIINPAEK
ncbi:PREDICTED: alpha-1-antitrypsin-like [Thamnophis sirtalis]|uniref:Thyroxine-binding globulin n=1 Tax=Thamnophis sirtalis TaxID=35019 RepID=A0A6I9YPL8_9SAUR|nr:PREDICTED: alpha-1-antitrypsin-like [Thamnophis sirtalis]